MLSFTQYPTFVVFLAVFLGAIVAMALMPVFIKFLRSHLIGQQVRADGPESHLVKQGTPTMGGIIMLIAATVVVAVLAEPVPETWLIMAAVLATGALGLFDDASKVAHERSLGLTPKAKLIGHFFISKAFVLAAVNWLGVPPTVDIPFVCTLDLGVLTTTLPVQVPAGGEFAIPWIYLIFADILLMGMSNATNLTDGLDGLLGGTIMVVMVVMAAITFRAGVLDAAIISAAIAGCCIGFLWFNSYPVRCGGPFGNHPGALFQENAQTPVPYGAAPSPFREKGLERSEGCYSFLDYLCSIGSYWILPVLCAVVDGIKHVCFF